MQYASSISRKTVRLRKGIGGEEEMNNKIYECIISSIKKGARVSNGGRYLSPKKHMGKIKALYEDIRYMEDFMWDEEGRNVVEVRFDKVLAK